jgi:hypothetical protein
MPHGSLRQKLPPGESGGRSGLTFSLGDQCIWADFGPDLGCNLLLIFILTLSTAGFIN